MEEVPHQLRLVVYPIIYKVLAPSQVVSRISEPLAVCQILDSAETTIGLWLRPQWPELISTTRCGYFGLFLGVPERCLKVGGGNSNISYFLHLFRETDSQFDFCIFIKIGVVRFVQPPTRKVGEDQQKNTPFFCRRKWWFLRYDSPHP